MVGNTPLQIAWTRCLQPHHRYGQDSCHAVCATVLRAVTPPSQAVVAVPEEVADDGRPRIAVLEVKALMAELDMKEAVMETLLSHLEVRPGLL